MICFTIFRIHKYSIHFCMIYLLKSLYCYTFLVISFVQYREYFISLFHSVIFRMCYLLLLVPELLVIFDAFVQGLIFWFLPLLLLYFNYSTFQSIKSQFSNFIKNICTFISICLLSLAPFVPGPDVLLNSTISFNRLL